MNLECQPGNSTLARILHAARQITCDDINISFTTEGLEFQGMDSAHVALVVTCIPAENFTHYHLTGVSITLGVHLPILCHVLSRASKYDTVRLQLCTTSATVLECHLINRTQHRIFQLSTLDLDIVTLDVPTIPYETCLTFPVQQLQVAFQDLALFGDDVCVQCAKQTITLTTTGSKGTGSISFPQQGNVTSLCLTFSLQYLRLFTKSPVCPSVNLHLAPDQPVLLTYSEYGSELRFYLAPKITNDDDE